MQCWPSSLGGQPRGSTQLISRWTLTHAQIKGVLDDGHFVVACVLGEFDANYRSTVRAGVGDCQRMVWQGVAGGSGPAHSPRTRHRPGPAARSACAPAGRRWLMPSIPNPIDIISQGLGGSLADLPESALSQAMKSLWDFSRSLLKGVLGVIAHLTVPNLDPARQSRRTRPCPTRRRSQWDQAPVTTSARTTLRRALQAQLVTVNGGVLDRHTAQGWAPGSPSLCGRVSPLRLPVMSHCRTRWDRRLRAIVHGDVADQPMF